MLEIVAARARRLLCAAGMPVIVFGAWPVTFDAVAEYPDRPRSSPS